jgi:hypothetical protein
VVTTSSPLLPNTLRILVLVWVQKGVILMGAQRGFVINGESVRDHSGHSVSIIATIAQYFKNIGASRGV